MELNVDTYHRLISAKQFIDEHYQEAIDLVAIAGRAYMSRFHFHRLFTKVYQVTPHQYLTRKRINKAKDLLIENRMSVSQVCCSVGFESLTSFSILFKKEIGYPPQYYRNMAFKKQQEAKQEPLKVIPFCFVESYGLRTEVLDRPEAKS